MKRKIKHNFISILLVVLFYLIPGVLSAWGKPELIPHPVVPLTVFKLLEQQTELNGKKISFQGEVIGQVIYEKQGAFINVMDSEYNALGIYMDKNLVKSILNFGRYGSKGDYIQATGIFHKICVQHGGDTDLHASSIKILSPGKRLPEPKIPDYKILISIFLLSLVIFLFTVTTDNRKVTKTPEKNRQKPGRS